MDKQAIEYFQKEFGCVNNKLDTVQEHQTNLRTDVAVIKTAYGHQQKQLDDQKVEIGEIKQDVKPLLKEQTVSEGIKGRFKSVSVVLAPLMTLVALATAAWAFFK